VIVAVSFDFVEAGSGPVAELHRHGAEAEWWHSIKIDPLPVAKTLWEQTRLDGMTRG